MNNPRSASLDEHGSSDAPPGTRPWAIAVRREAHSALHDPGFSSRGLRIYLDLIREHQGYLQLTDRQERPFPTFEAFCVAPYPFGLGYQVEEIDRLIVERGKREAKDLAEWTQPLGCDFGLIG